MINTKKITKIIIISGVVIVALSTSISIYYKKQKAKADKKILPVGLTKGQEEYFKKELALTGKQYRYIQKGNILLREDNIDGAILEYEKALRNAYSNATRSEACRHLADAYEKKKNYKKALEYIITVRDKYVNDWAKAPVIERAKYLTYANRGNYEMAVAYAKKALEVETDMLYNKGVPSQGYIDRLNDLIAAKGYVLSLKKE